MNGKGTNSNQEFVSRSVLWTAVASVAFFVIFVVVQGFFAGTGREFIPLDFDNSGKFGDSFGLLTSLMSSVAAVGAWSAVMLQRRELKIAEEQKESADKERQQREFDSHFYQLLENFETLVQGIDHRLETIHGPEIKKGRDAIRLFADQAIARVTRCGRDDREETFGKWASENQDDFGHYFRFLYHLVKFIDEVSPNSVVPMAFLRAKLSEPELILLAFNCAFGDGRGPFKWLTEKYHLLHNISDNSRESFDLGALFNERAFAPGMRSKFLGTKAEKRILSNLGEEWLYTLNKDDPSSPYRDRITDHQDIVDELISGDITVEIARDRYQARVAKADEEIK